MAYSHNDVSNTTHIDSDELLPLIKEKLSMGGSIKHLSFHGVSMRPMLRQDRDTVDISPLPEKLCRYDLPIYQRSDGKFVMHRVISSKNGFYLCLGDNTENFETVYPHQMIAVVSAFTRNGKHIKTTNPLYRIYCHLWCPTRPLRKLIKKSKFFLKKHLKRKPK